MERPNSSTVPDPPRGTSGTVTPSSSGFDPSLDARYRPSVATAYDAPTVTFTALCPADGCGRVIGWVDSKTDGPQPGDCDCDIERNAA